jgi:hypothetical protein
MILRSSGLPRMPPGSRRSPAGTDVNELADTGFRGKEPDGVLEEFPDLGRRAWRGTAMVVPLHPPGAGRSPGACRCPAFHSRTGISLAHRRRGAAARSLTSAASRSPKLWHQPLNPGPAAAVLRY